MRLSLASAAVAAAALLLASAGVLGLVLAGFVASREPPGLHPFFERRQVANIAHRGAQVEAPEATLPAFAMAASLGVDILEMDVHLTADGRLVVFHDETVDRTTDGSGRIADMTMDEVRRLNAGHFFEAPDGSHPYRNNPLPPPALEEVLEAHPEFAMVIEMKTAATAEPLCSALRAADREERTLVGAFAGESLARFRVVCPEVATSASFFEAGSFLILSKLGLAKLFLRDAVEGPDALFVSEVSAGIRVLTPGFLRDAQERRLPVVVWTVNDRADMERLLDLGVDGIITDDPRTLKAVLDSRRSAP